MSRQVAVAMVHVKAKAGVKDEAIIAAAQEVQDAFLRSQPGYLSRELLKVQEDGTWIDVVHFQTMEEAQRSLHAMMSEPSVQKMQGLTDPATFRLFQAALVKKL